MKKPAKLLIAVMCCAVAPVQASWLSEISGPIDAELIGGAVVQRSTPPPCFPKQIPLAIAILHVKAQAAYMCSANFSRAFDSARIALGRTVILLNNDVAAMTLDGMVVFRNPLETKNIETSTHDIMEYRSLGVEAFAQAYIASGATLETKGQNNAARATISSIREIQPASSGVVSLKSIGMDGCYFGEAVSLDKLKSTSTTFIERLPEIIKNLPSGDVVALQRPGPVISKRLSSSAEIPNASENGSA